MDSYEIVKLRNNKVVKANTLIQQSRHQFTVQQQKALLFLISQLKPAQTEFDWQIFDISEFCRVCGIEVESGKNYRDLKLALQSLSDKSMWIRYDDEEQTESLVRWLDKIQLKAKSGRIKVRFDEEMKPFLLELKARFTAFDLKYTLAMRSKYSVRLYELLKSYVNQHETVRFDLERFKKLVGAEYERWVDVRRKVIDVATREINEVSDLNVSYTPIKKGRSFNAVVFDISVKRDMQSQIQTERAIFQRLTKQRQPEPIEPIPGQISFDGSEVKE